jgi:hypothetical protein
MLIDIRVPFERHADIFIYPFVLVRTTASSFDMALR